MGPHAFCSSHAERAAGANGWDKIYFKYIDYLRGGDYFGYSIRARIKSNR